MIRAQDDSHASVFFGLPLGLRSDIICGIRSSNLSRNESRFSVNSRIGLLVEFPILKFRENVLPSPNNFDIVITSTMPKEYHAKKLRAAECGPIVVLKISS